MVASRTVAVLNLTLSASRFPQTPCDQSVFLTMVLLSLLVLILPRLVYAQLSASPVPPDSLLLVEPGGGVWTR